MFKAFILMSLLLLAACSIIHSEDCKDKPSASVVNASKDEVAKPTTSSKKSIAQVEKLDIPAVEAQNSKVETQNSIVEASGSPADARAIHSEIITGQRRIYVIQPSGTQCLDEYANINPVTIGCNNGVYQMWWGEPVDRTMYFRIRSFRTGKVLESNWEGSTFTTGQTGSDFQLWHLLQRGTQNQYRLQNKMTGRYLNPGFPVNSNSNSPYWGFYDITPKVLCPQMNDRIGNSGGILANGAGFFQSCWDLQYWMNGGDVEVGAVCGDGSAGSKWSTLRINAFQECL